MAKQLQTNIIIGGKASPSLNRAFQTAQKQAQSTSKVMGRIGGAVKSAAKVAAVGVAAAGASLVALGAKGLETASDLTEVQNVVDTTFKSGSKAIDKWSSKAIEAYGLSTLQAKQYTGTLGALMKSSGVASGKLVQMSTKLAGLAGDFASFHNLSQDDAFEKIRSGISGETEPLKALGINMSVANLEAFALSKGIKAAYSSMDQASQTQLRYLYLMEKSKDAQGDFSKTLGTSFANQKRVAITKINETLGLLAKNLLPMATEGLKNVNAMLTKFAANPKLIKTISGAISGIGTIMGKVGEKIVPMLTTIFDKYLIPNLPKIMGLMNSILNIAGQLFNTVILPLMPIIMDIFSAVTPLISGLLPLLMPVINALMNLLLPVLNEIAPVIRFLTPLIMFLAKIALTQITGVINMIAPVIRNIINILNNLMQYIQNVFTGNWSAAWQNVRNIFSNLFAGLVSLVKMPFNAIINNINSVLKNINGVKIPDWVPLLGGQGISIPLIPMLAKGATVSKATMAMIGEAGPETVVPHNNKPRSRVLLAEAAAGVGYKLGGDTYTIHFSPVIQGGGSDIRQQVSAAGEEFERRMDSYFAKKRRLSYV